ncbi:DUF5689 domain-containing protein [Pedobacter kyonggii]|uniref:DUF5689 domain-containing protein n=1 Tax=Pedobacter kyonggii TaxID=1926871 RepID=A0A4V2JGH6_9SPHI|nr:DUF5689 domain-containing protein [Pedobacter kyonggii]TBO40519.1 hypothetical protein EYS08_18575 [Pedobacter kyonggii]
MKNRYLYIYITAVIFAFAGCKKHDFAAGTVSTITYIEDVRSLYKGTDLIIDKESLTGAGSITGVVISNADSGNVPPKTVVIQSTRKGRIRGLVLNLENSSIYKPGDSLLIKVEGSSLKRVKGSLQISGLTDASIAKISSNNRINIQTASSYNIGLKPDEYESTLVQIKSGLVNPLPAFGDSFIGDKSVVNGADSIILHTEATANYATTALPAGATFTGIVFINNEIPNRTPIQLWPRVSTDITERVAPPNPNGPGLGVFPVVITGIVADAKGGDGNYEYIQFRATKDIDFTKNSLSVITCTNAGTAAPYAGTAPAGGWATGGGRTYKFNLTSGTVAKGEFFYVGGSNQRINGANSTSLSTSKWIRSIAYVTNDGDGFGSKNGGIFPNSGNAGGVAVFEGTIINEESVPLDVVFFGGTGKTTLFNSVDNYGYRIVKNDHYNPVDPATSTAQPFFFQGTNQYIIPHAAVADLGLFLKLGGSFNATTKTWTTARGAVYYQMSLTTPVSEIESGADVTQVTN